MTEDNITTPEAQEDAYEPTLEDGTGVSESEEQFSDDGDRQPEEDWATRYKSARSQMDAANIRAKEAEARAAALQAQMQQAAMMWQSQQQQPRPGPSEQYGQDFLTESERRQLQEAEEIADLSTIRKIENLAMDRKLDAREQRAYMWTQYQQQMAAAQQQELAEFQQYEDLFNDPVHSMEVLAEAARLQADPRKARRIKGISDQTAYAQIQGKWINRYALLEACEKRREALESAKAKAIRAGRPPNAIGGAPRSSGEPGETLGEGSRFNPSLHFTPEERSRIDGFMKKGTGKKMSYKDYWDAMPAEARKQRLRNPPGRKA